MNIMPTRLTTGMWLIYVLRKANVFSYSARSMTVHRCNSAEDDPSENGATTLRITSPLVMACFERKGQRRRTGQKEVKIRSSHNK